MEHVLPDLSFMTKSDVERIAEIYCQPVQMDLYFSRVYGGAYQDYY